MTFNNLKTFIFLLSVIIFNSSYCQLRPISWSQYSITWEDELESKIKTLVNHSLKYLLNIEVAGYQTGSDNLYDFGGFGEYEIRSPAQVICALGIATKLGVYDSAIVGFSNTQADSIQEKLIQSIFKKHKANGGGWGNCWQCAHWAFFAGMGTWMSIDLLDAATKTLVENVIVSEADYFDRDPPYCNDCTNDTKAEENAWNANILALAMAALPQHSNFNTWKTRASQWMVSAFARQSDLSRDTLVDGLPVKDWITGWNMREESYVYNHDRIHPDYTAAAYLNLWNPVVFFLGEQKILEASFWNSDLVYEHLVDFTWTTPPYDSPGGTIYRRDTDSIYATVYYPQGTTWTPFLQENYFMLDVQSHSLGLDGKVSIPAEDWMKVRTDFLLWMQSRSTTGQLYINSDNLNYPPKESKVSAYFAFAYLNLFLSKQSDWGTEANGFPFPEPTVLIFPSKHLQLINGSPLLDYSSNLIYPFLSTEGMKGYYDIKGQKAKYLKTLDSEGP